MPSLVIGADTTSMQVATPRGKHAGPAAVVAHTAKNIRPILKTSAQVLGKRRMSDDEDTMDELNTDALSGARKRQKVEFDLNNIEVHEIGVRTVDEIKTEIRKALEGHERGDDEEYDILKDTLSGKQVLRHDDIEDGDPSIPEKRRQELKIYLVALASFAPQLGRSSSGLVKSVLQCEWLGRDDQFAKIYVQFLAALVSAQGSCLNPVLTMIVDKFSAARVSDWSVPNFPPVNKQLVQRRLHLALQYLLSVFPAAKTVLGHVVAQKYPFHDDSKRMHLAYVDNMLRLREYAPSLKNEIMDLIVSRLVKIDVEMQMDLEDMDDRVTAMVAMALKSSQENNLEDADDDDDSDAESVDSEESEEDNEYARVKTAKESIEKMDYILDALFRLYTPHFADPDSDDAMDVFTDLLGEFSHIILPNLKSRHTQFLIFHFGQQSEQLMDAFCGTCINIAFESSRPPVLQQAASAYLASFVARGAHVPGHIVVKIFEVLGFHLDQMRTNYEATCRGPDVRRYAPFYSLMQALMYIYCFRWQDLVRSVPEDVDRDDLASYLDQDLEWEPEIREVLRRNIYSKLNPLKVCSPAIVEQFAKLAHRFRFLYVYPLLESNKRVRLSQFSAGAYSSGNALRDLAFDLNDESWQQLDSYFPFDPYQLPVSKHWVEGDYLPWRSITGLDDDDDDDDDDVDSDNEDDLDEENGIEEDTATDDEEGVDN
ncbi:RNA polymerase I-specific transcription initiation factor RRN3 [Microdochium trichocladiopsis]|uniref:RNA polymerase I-specific transcription initiation factor RRN3 n=1 Tax=Microdochium trichocladiopsis TaxID=1682393 RepID=A0A9P8YD95_9PEZI|nr:RNA polymerase I-specific transcription initiation factor RRN3 [Microdochium trichocladiopsis]KAH7034938.1 RNA polymerase I-specific transcription initiation factor RRN3 [Microdochium trichocladiopsis]